MKHPLHEAIGVFIKELKVPSHYEVILSPECGGKQNIPLFCSENRGNDTEFCNADILVRVDGKVRLIVEIEESDLSPTRVCGKFLTSALSKYLIHDQIGNLPIQMSMHVTFIQVLDSKKLPENSAKGHQGKNLEISIRKVIPLAGSTIDDYRLFFFRGVRDFHERNAELGNSIHKAAQRG
jgi:hypothetical protein